MNSRSLLIIGTVVLTTGLLSARLRRQAPVPYKLEYPDYFGNRIDIPDDNPMTEEGVRLGRMLFYEKVLSANGQFSCGTCHRQELAFTDGKKFSAGVDGVLQSRNTMSLVNLLWVRNFFWDGRARGLEQQADTPLINIHEMGQPLEVSVRKLKANQMYLDAFRAAFGSNGITPTHIVMALAQFERTLISAGSKYDKYLRGKYEPTAAEANGITLFFTNPDIKRGIRGASCSHCHDGPKTFSELYHNNGLDSIPADKGRGIITGLDIDRGRFRVVTLRNIALTAPYMHDGRFATLEEVVDHYSSHVQNSPTLSPFLQGNSNSKEGKGLDLTREEKKDLVAFLHMLTDTDFITDARFSNPFN